MELHGLRFMAYLHVHYIECLNNLLIWNESVSAWMDAYFNLIGDKMPDKNQIHLPSWETQKDIYSYYIGDINDRGMSEEKIAGISAFCKIWTEQFSNVVIPQVWVNTV